MNKLAKKVTEYYYVVKWNYLIISTHHFFILLSSKNNINPSIGVKPVPAARSTKVSFFSTTIKLKGPKGLLNSTWSPTFLSKYLHSYEHNVINKRGEFTSNITAHFTVRIPFNKETYMVPGCIKWHSISKYFFRHWCIGSGNVLIWNRD